MKATRTQATANLLNTIAREIAASDPSKSEAEIRNLSISIAIKGLTDKGLPIRDAFDTIMGEGQYDILAETTFTTLRA